METIFILVKKSIQNRRNVAAKTRSTINKPVKVQFESSPVSPESPQVYLQRSTYRSDSLPLLKFPKATMTSYLITGVSRGIGVRCHQLTIPQRKANGDPQFEFLRQLSADTTNTVIGLVRNKDATEKKIAAELGQRSNVHILQADLTDYAAIKESTPKELLLGSQLTELGRRLLTK
jgi:hypothetical protein